MATRILSTLPVSTFIYREYLRFIEYLYKPCNPTPLALFRILFGFLMFLDIPQERGLEDADIRFGDPNYCFFPLFNWVQPVSVQIACVLYSFMWAGSVGMMVGLKFRGSCFLFLGPYMYFFLLDKSRWNNHSYLFALITLLMSGSGAANHMSLDAILQHKETKQVPMWNYFVLRFQLFILYFFAGLKKLDADWIGGFSMKNLSRHKIFSPIKLVLQPDAIEYYMVHIGGLIYDLSCGFLLNFEFSKKLGIFLSVAFHGMNSQLFDIGMFPYVCLASLILFCTPHQFPCNLLPVSCQVNEDITCGSEESWKKERVEHKRNRKRHFTAKEKATGAIVLVHIGLQIFMPFSHFITTGYNNWTPGLYGYSWDMMVNSWETLHQKVTVRNRITGTERYLDPDVWVANDRWSSHADMAVQYSQCIERNLGRFNITEIEVYFDIWKSLNGRFQQRIFDPRTDILRAPWSPFESVPWILPLLQELSHFRRSHFESISHSVANWTTSSDVIFVADFPGLFLENFLPSDLTNITVTLLSGRILVEQKGLPNVTLSELGRTSTSIRSNDFHKIHTISIEPHPSTYMYTYTNRTQLAETNKQSEKTEAAEKGSFTFFQDLQTFFQDKADIFWRSLCLVVNAHLSLLFDVPMVIRKSVNS